MTDAVRHTRLDRYLAEKLRADGYGGLCGDDCGCECDDLTSPYSGVTLRVVAATKHSCRHVTLTTNTGRDVIVDDTQKVQWKRTR